MSSGQASTQRSRSPRTDAHHGPLHFTKRPSEPPAGGSPFRAHEHIEPSALSLKPQRLRSTGTPHHTRNEKPPFFHAIRDTHVPDCFPAFTHRLVTASAIRGRFVSDPALILSLHMQSFLICSLFVPHIAFWFLQSFPCDPSALQ